MILKKYLFLTFLFVFSVQLNAQYSIDVHIKNLPDSTIYLCYYYGDKQYAKDTLVLDNKGKGVFESKDTLQGGLYFVLLPGNQIFELIIDKNQKFSVSTTYTGKYADLTKNLKSKGSVDMNMYSDYQVFMSMQNELATSLRKRHATTKDDKIKKQIADSLSLLNDKVHQKWNEVKTNYPESLLASILKCLTEIEVPDPPKDENGNVIDTMFQINYYKKHYYDNINFLDDRLIRTPFYHSKLLRYFNKVIIPAPDTIIKESYRVLKLAEANDDVFQYTLQTLFNKYNGSEVMGMDKVFVFFAENYYLKDRANWADTVWLKKVKKRVLELKPNLIGNKAPALNLITDEDKNISLDMINSDFTVLFFYEPNCGHCKKATPKLKKISEKYWEKGVEVLAIYTQKDKKEWLNFIKEKQLENWINVWDPYNQSHFRQKYDMKGTPLIYVLDKNKIIIAKNIDVENLDIILENEIKIKSNN